MFRHGLLLNPRTDQGARTCLLSHPGHQHDNGGGGEGISKTMELCVHLCNEHEHQEHWVLIHPPFISVFHS